MDEAQLLEATQQAYDAYWFAHEGRRNGSKLKAWANLDQDEIDALVVATAAVEAYIAAIPE